MTISAASARLYRLAGVRYPPAPPEDTCDVLHGKQVPDPYRWLEDRTGEQTRDWLDDQARLFGQVAGTWTGREYWRGRIRDLLGAGVIGTPVWRGERAFLMRRDPGQEHAVAAVIEPDGSTRILVDPHELDPSGLTTLDSVQPSREGDLIAYQLSEGGSEESALRVMDVTTGEVIDGPIDRVRYSPVAWLPGGKAFYYVRRLAPELVPDHEQQFHRRVWLHEAGTDPGSDVLIFGSGRQPTQYYGVQVSLDGRWLAVSASEGTAPRNDLWIADLTANSPQAPALRVVQEEVDAQTSVHFGRDGRMYVFTDLAALRGRLCVADPADPGAGTWTDLIPEDPEAVLDGYAILDGPELGDEPQLLASWIRHAVSEITTHRLADGARTGSLTLPGIGSVGGISERPEGGHEAWFSYTDFTTVQNIYRYDARDGSQSLWASPPGAVAVPAISASMRECRSADGTVIRLFLLAPADGVDPETGLPDRPRPTVLYGYGGFGIPMTPGYSAAILAWVEAGGVYAIACLRGGGEEGEQWHRAGMLGHKQDVFDDFRAAADWLTGHGWTTSEQLAVSGGSNGGLLVGAALTQWPEKLAAAHCSAPLLDMVRYEHSGLGATWSVEYGSAADPQEFAWLWSYSPYHHVRDGVRYPATLFTVFEGDTRVDPMHARKMCAALQHAAAPDSGPVLIRSERDVGHGARALSRSVDLAADVQAFLATYTGLRIPR